MLAPLLQHKHLTVGLVVVLAGLLVLLGFLQYRWLGRLSEGERARMEATLETSVERFAESIDREFTRVSLAFTPEPADPGVPEAKDLAARLARWRQASAHAPLVEAVYWVDRPEGAPVRLQRLDPAAGRLDPMPWPAEFASWRRHFETLFRPEADGAERFSQYLALGRPSGLLIPVAARSGEAVLRQRQVPGMPFTEWFGGRVTGFLLIRFDDAYLRGTLIPELARTYFAQGDELAYDLLVTSAHAPDSVYYRSAQELVPADFPAPDAVAPVGRLRFEDLLFVHLPVGVERPGIAGPADSLRPEGIAVRVLSEETVHATRGTERQTFLARRITGPEAGVDTVRHRFVAEGQVPPRHVIKRAGVESRVLLKHRAGSLEAAVAQARWRNGLVSFGILLVLGATVVLLVLSSRRAQELARQQVEFVAGVSHELRTPLAVIRSAAENLADGLVHEPGQARRYGALILDEGRRLSRMVEQVLRFAGTLTEGQPQEARPVAVGPLVARVLDDHRPALAVKGLVLDLDLPEGLPEVLGDPAALGSAVDNLVSNAVKYSPAGGHIGLSACPATFRGAAALALSVQDAGPGIPADELPRIFEPFYRGRDAREAQVEGSGIGLSLVRRIARSHGGDVTVRSTPGAGSRFTLFLPAAASTGSGAAPLPHADLSLAS